MLINYLHSGTRLVGLRHHVHLCQRIPGHQRGASQRSSEEGSLDPVSVFVELDDRRANKGGVISPAGCNLLGRSPNLGWIKSVGGQSQMVKSIWVGQNRMVKIVWSKSDGKIWVSQSQMVKMCQT